MVVGERRQDVLRRWVPGILGGISGFAAFHGINEASGGSLKDLPTSGPPTLVRAWTPLLQHCWPVQWVAGWDSSSRDGGTGWHNGSCWSTGAGGL